MLECGGTLRHDVIAVQACRDAAANNGTMYRAHERHGQRLQRSEAFEGATQRGSGSGERCAEFLVRVRAGTWREVRAGAAQHYCTHRSAICGKLLGRQRKILP